MPTEKWIETKKECEVDANDNQIVKRVTLEREKSTAFLGLEKKDALDLIFRLIGLTAIFVPLWLFYQQQQA